MVFKQKGKFELTIDCLQQIVDNVLKQQGNEDVEITIDPSPYNFSKSLYLRFYIGDYTTSLRISDHECKGDIRQMIVTETTGVANVYYKINSTIKDLRLKQVYGLIDRGL